METEILASRTSQQRDEVDDEETMAEFTRNIQEIVLTLASILRDTLRVAQLPDSGEPHMKMDLYHQIADGYKNAPDLRITWLSDLAALQLKHEGNVEAGMAHLQCAIIIAEYLLSVGKIEKHLVPWDTFQSVFPIAQEFGECSEEAVCQSNSFTVTGLIDALNLAVKYFMQSEYYEYAAQIYKIICPIQEHSQMYKELANSYTQLQSCWSSVNEKNTERLFGKYFRVGFYGEKFGDLNGTQYIYKEPKLTHILEMSERLKDFYSQQTGEDILTLDASKSLDSLDPTKCFMQITHMEPFRNSPTDTAPRNSFFEKNTKLSEFMYETPFTMSGKAHAEHVSEQYKRKTVLVVTDSFPHLLCRLPVASQYDIIVSPLENAIEDIEKRNVVLETEISSRNPKTLRQVLQGSVRLQVNEGAVAVCKIFLGSYKEHPREHIQQLCESIGTFLTLCRVALAQNKSFIESDDDRMFQQAMESGFQELEPVISSLLRKVVYDADDETSDTNTNDDDDSMSIDTPEVQLRPVRRKTASKAKSHRRSRSMDHGRNIKRSDMDKITLLRELPSDDYQPPSKISKAQISAKNTPSHPIDAKSLPTKPVVPTTPDLKRRIHKEGPLSPRQRSASISNFRKPPAVPPRRPARKQTEPPQ